MFGRRRVLNGRYHLIEEVGAGGMGVVYRSRDRARRTTVAVKLLHAHLTRDEDYRRRFGREADVTRTLASTHVVAVMDVDADGANCFLVMEYVDGPSLRQVLRACGQLGPAESFEVARQVALGLEEAHARGIVHRDLKPANILITRTGAVKIGDFGVARAQGNETLTVSRGFAGTVHYLAPEAESGHADARSDIYALGVVLYEMVTGNRPFSGDDPWEVLRDQRDAPVPIETLAVCGSEGAALIIRCLAKDPALRYQTAGELRAALAALEGGQPDLSALLPRVAAGVCDRCGAAREGNRRLCASCGGRIASPSSRRRTIVASAVCVSVLAAAVGGGLFARHLIGAGSSQPSGEAAAAAAPAATPDTTLATTAGLSQVGACTFLTPGVSALAAHEPYPSRIEPNAKKFACIVALNNGTGQTGVSAADAVDVTISFAPPMRLGGVTYQDGVAVLAQTDTSNTPDPGNTNTVRYHIATSGIFAAQVGIDDAKVDSGSSLFGTQVYSTSSHMQVAFSVNGSVIDTKVFTVRGEPAVVNVPVRAGDDLEIAVSNLQAESVGAPSEPGQVDIVNAVEGG